jgi:hypothetical protein
MRKWILWIIVVSIMISIMPGCIGESGGSGGSGVASGILDDTFGNNGIVVHHNAAGGNSHDGGYSIYVDSNGKIYVTGYSINSSGNADIVI